MDLGTGNLIRAGAPMAEAMQRSHAEYCPEPWMGVYPNSLCLFWMAAQHDLITAEVHPKGTRSKVKAFWVSRDVGKLWGTTFQDKAQVMTIFQYRHLEERVEDWRLMGQR